MPVRQKAAAVEQLVSSTDVQVFAAVRCILSVAGLVLIWMDPAEPKRWVALTYSSLAAYAAYNLCVVYAAHKRQWLAPSRAMYWADVLFAGYLVSLTEGTFSAYWFFFFFSIMAASFSNGFREGFLVTIACTLLFIIAGALVSPHALSADFDRALIRPVSLLSLGFLIAYWGGFEIRLKRKLALLGELTRTFDPRADQDEVIANNVNDLRAFFDADAGIVILNRAKSVRAFLARRTKSGHAPAVTIEKQVPEPTAGELMSLGHAIGRYAGGRFHHSLSSTAIVQRGSAATPAGGATDDAKGEAIANLLSAPTFLTVPYVQADGTKGRVFLTWSRRRRSDPSEAAFLSQWSATLATAVANLTLHQQLVTDATQLERLISSRDLHDEVVQPYIALKLALEALATEVSTQEGVLRRLNDVIAMTDATVADLRKIASDMRAGSFAGTSSLRNALRVQVERYARFFGIHIELSYTSSRRLSQSAAITALRIVSEALSNVLRHTRAKRVFVSLRSDGAALVIEIRNEIQGAVVKPFTPASIAERVKAFGGVLHVVPDENGYTILRATLLIAGAGTAA